jgi:flagellar basal body rod protein FlgG
MKSAICAFAIWLVLGVASSAQVSCQDVGNFTYCNNGQTFQHNGDFTYDNEGHSWQHNGNFTYGSDGSTYQHNGNFTYDNQGNTWQRNGNFTYGPNGSTCQIANVLATSPTVTDGCWVCRYEPSSQLQMQLS